MVTAYHFSSQTKHEDGNGPKKRYRFSNVVVMKLQKNPMDFKFFSE